MSNPATAEGPMSVRRMTLNELPLMRDWAEAEGWNPGLGDAPAFWAADPEGFFVGEVAGEPVACVSCVKYSVDFGFLGLYIVRPQHRGRGYGIGVWNTGLAHLTGCTIGLDGVLAQVPNYERSGFQLAHETTRYLGEGGGDIPQGLVPLEKVPLADIVAYDATCFPAQRASFVQAWLANPHALGRAAMTGGRLTGYGVLRRCVTGYKVGPLFADDAMTAERLLAGLRAAIPGQSYWIDLPDATVQAEGGRLVQAFGLTETFRTARMYRGTPPDFATARVFGVTSLELG